MDQPETRTILDRYFVDCKIDVDRMTGGKDVQDRYTAGKSTGIPVFFFVNGAGKTVATSIGKDGNIGYPGGDEEAPQFQGMLNAAHVSKADAAALMASVRIDKK